LINRPKGTADILGTEIPYWNYFEYSARTVARSFGYQEIRTPVFERTDLFVRGVGDDTDIVQKEMYTFQDKGNRSMTLRPEGTAPVIRAFIENALRTVHLPHKLFYFGPMFRYERPQAGRQRQFHQFGIELAGSSLPISDGEVIWFSVFLLEMLGLKRHELQINHLGCEEDRARFRQALIDYYTPHAEHLCADCNRRLSTNPLRLLDCKVPGDVERKKEAPSLSQFLCAQCSHDQDQIKTYLEHLGIPYVHNERLVRGLDYYTGMVFEVIYPFQDRTFDILGGGRYDRLIESLGGGSIPSVGFACGMERIVEIMKEEQITIPDHHSPQVYILTLGEEARSKGLIVADFLRKRSISVVIDLMDRNISHQMKYASKINSRFTVLIGENELQRGVYTVKDMESGAQTEVDDTWIENFLLEELKD